MQSEASPATASNIKRGTGPTAEVAAALVQAAYSPPFDYGQSTSGPYLHPSPSAALSQLIYLLPGTARAPTRRGWSRSL